MKLLLNIAGLAVLLAFMGALLYLLAGFIMGARLAPGWLRLVTLPVAIGGFIGFAIWLGMWLDNPNPREHWRSLPLRVGIGAGILLGIQLLALVAHYLF